VADRNNNRVILLSPDKRIVWHVGLRGPDDAFFTPASRRHLNEEFNDTLADLTSADASSGYGHRGGGKRGGYLNAPDDACRMVGGVTISDIRNCRIVRLRPGGTTPGVLGRSCVHNPPQGFAARTATRRFPTVASS
jgi:hypothetical protein